MKHSPVAVEEFTVAAILLAVVLIAGSAILCHAPSVIAQGWAR